MRACESVFSVWSAKGSVETLGPPRGMHAGRVYLCTRVCDACLELGLRPLRLQPFPSASLAIPLQPFLPASLVPPLQPLPPPACIAPPLLLPAFLHTSASHPPHSAVYAPAGGAHHTGRGSPRCRSSYGPRLAHSGAACRCRLAGAACLWRPPRWAPSLGWALPLGGVPSAVPVALKKRTVAPE